ncbi:hypothetical protein POX_f07408 [Penicillium oxalicum]|uniref:hypothetical protein n=1 Tax=Penicillium oxalicum TaxID=69781 RepID=UPI0020B78F47|nr:hypothetical protein POX_f07408 [Penicillium oxalicum]KAI2787053.1 hypothetical protein POX_f07408 [Penicillium oxalicum]
MDAPASVARGDRPCKRRRDDSEANDSQVTNEQQTRDKTLCALYRIRAVPRGMKLSLIEEMKRILDENPRLASTTIEFLDLYLFLWESYVIDSAHKIRLEEEQQRLQAENAWLIHANNRLYQACTDRELVLWDRQEAFDSVQEAVVKVLKSLRVPWITR